MARIARFKYGAYTRPILKTGVFLVLALALDGALALGGLDETATVPMAIKPEDKAAKSFTPAAGRSNIYVYREQDNAFLYLFQLVVDGQFVGGIAPKTYHVIEATPGLHVLSALAIANQRDTQIFVEAGKNYFAIVIGLDGDTYVPRVNIWQVSVEEGTAGVLKAKRAEGSPVKSFAPIDSEPAPEYLSHRDAILADPNIERVLTRYYNSNRVWRRLRDGTMRAGLSKMTSISDLRLVGVNKDFLKIQGKYKWRFDSSFDREYSDYIVFTLKKFGGDYDILRYELGAWKY